MTTKTPQNRYLLHNVALLTCDGPDRGPLATWEALGWRPQAEVIVAHNGKRWETEWLGAPGDPQRPNFDRALDLGGRLMTPGWIDCHTHAVFAGDRSHEFAQRLTGRTYAEIAAAGGGIVHTVGATRAASVADLVAATAPRLAEMAAWGTPLSSTSRVSWMSSRSPDARTKATSPSPKTLGVPLMIAMLCKDANGVKPTSSPAKMATAAFSVFPS